MKFQYDKRRKKKMVKKKTMREQNLTNHYIIAQVSGKQCFFQPGQWYDLDVIQEWNKFIQTNIFSRKILGNFVYLNKILLFKNATKVQIGKPFLEKSKIPVKIVQEVKGKKITVLKTKPKKKYTRVRGHRQGYTRVQVDITR